MKTFILLGSLSCFCFMTACGQKLKEKDVPAAAKKTLTQKFPRANKVFWEKENGNYEANWGGKSGEDNSVIFSPQGQWLETEKAVAYQDLPAQAKDYLASKYKVHAAKEVIRDTKADGKVSYEVEVKKKTLIFDDQGAFLKAEEGEND